MDADSYADVSQNFRDALKNNAAVVSTTLTAIMEDGVSLRDIRRFRYIP